MTTPSTLLFSALIIVLIISGWAAFMVRQRQLTRLKKQVEEMEKEMLNNHRELLKLETELAKRLTVSVRNRE
jgi:uncharacterized membrane protein (DUF106 family)